MAQMGQLEPSPDWIDMRFEIGNKEDAFKIRTLVFIEEQGFDDEFDDIDDYATHITLYQGDTLIGCSRIFPSEEEPKHYIFGRLAVIPEERKKGLGNLLLEESERQAIKQGAREMRLHAQCRAQGFYEQAGYTAYGPIEFEEHVEHIWMKKELV